MAAATARPSVDLSKESRESLSQRSVKELREIAKSAHISMVGCIEKSEMVEALMKAK